MLLELKVRAWPAFDELVAIAAEAAEREDWVRLESALNLLQDPGHGYTCSHTSVPGLEGMLPCVPVGLRFLPTDRGLASPRECVLNANPVQMPVVDPKYAAACA